MSDPIELRYADMDWGRELDEVVLRYGVDVVMHAEDLGQGVAIMLYHGLRHVHVVAYTDRMPRALWWDEIQEAWYERRWPCFWRTRLRLIEDYEWKVAP